ncbi:MAG: hypothetical protein KY464_07830 [Gemmatimonadetes bacterium]|nr:hypothetical protein [Gemmatimonadota bacterium]
MPEPPHYEANAVRATMRRLSLPLLLISLAGGCSDALGIGGGCAADMNLVRRKEGGPPQSTQGPTELSGGVFEEVWFYFASGARRGQKYTFRWGTSIGSCQVSAESVSRSVLRPREGGLSTSGDGETR